MSTKGKTEEEWNKIQDSIMLLLDKVDDIHSYKNSDNKKVINNKELLLSIKKIVSHLDPDKSLAVRLKSNVIELASRGE